MRLHTRSCSNKGTGPPQVHNYIGHDEMGHGYIGHTAGLGAWKLAARVNIYGEGGPRGSSLIRRHFFPNIRRHFFPTIRRHVFPTIR